MYKIFKYEMRKDFKLKPTDARQIFRTYVELIKPFLKKLRSRECDVFAEILYQYSLKNKTLAPKDKMTLVLNSEGRELIANQLNISQPILRNAINGLRKRKILQEHDLIPDIYLLDLKEKVVTLTFILPIK